MREADPHDQSNLLNFSRPKRVRSGQVWWVRSGQIKSGQVNILV